MQEQGKERSENRYFQTKQFWGQAAYLHERLPLPSPASVQSLEQEIHASKRLDHWRKSFGSQGTPYQQWLKHTGLSEQELLQMLREDEQSLHQRLSHPAWVDQFSSIVQEPGEVLSDTFLFSLIERVEAPEEQIDARPLLIAAEPFLRHAQTYLLSKLELFQADLPVLLLDSSQLVHSLLSSLALQFLQLLSRALVLEFRVAQQQSQCFPGETTQTQLSAYAQTLRQQNHLLAFFAEYPVLARQIVLATEQWCSSHLEMLERFLQDWPALQKMFWPEQMPGLLISVRSEAGDRHCGGRSVQILSFASGARLVYKPRSLAVDGYFQELLQWLNAHSQTPPLRTLHILPGEGYGWMEWVEVFTEGCHSLEEVERFYIRQGVNLALLYLLGATDFHLENILAAGEDPILIDLESLFHVYMPHSRAGFNAAEQLAYEHAVTSVLRTLLLPSQVTVGDKKTWLEIGGLGGAAGQILPDQAIRLSSQQSNELRFMHTELITSGAQNRPRLHGEEIDPSRYLPQLIAGFRETYRTFLAHREALWAPHGPLAAFRKVPIRVVLRPTETYGQLLFACTHPNVLRNDLDRERLITQLWRAVPDQPYLTAVFSSEMDDLRQGNIPYFTTQVDAHDLWTSSGERLPNFFSQSGFALAQRLWQQLSEQDLARQIWFIQVSFTALSSETEQTSGRTLVQIHEEISREVPPAVTQEELLAAACQIGDRLCHLAIQQADEATWLGLEQPDGQHWMLTVADLSLYNGLAGIILMLSYLGHVTGIARYTTQARAGYATLYRRMRQDQDTWTSVGFFIGWGGIIATLSHLAALWSDEGLLEEARHIVARLPALIAQDQTFDLIGGCAGCCAGLRCLAALDPSPQITETLRLCGTHLAAHALSMAQGIGWPAWQELPPLTGMAHGNAGIAWALLHIAQATGETRFRDLAREALAYERSQFLPEQKNWRDLRMPVGEQERNCNVAWCHGAAGIGLARLQMLPDLQDDQIQAEILAACETTLRQGFGLNHSLCHGDLGNLELLYQAQYLFPERHWQADYEWRKAISFARGQRLGWQCGTPQQVETPGLMLGLAGIGLQLLRLAEPTRVPSLLSFDMPQRNARS